MEENLIISELQKELKLEFYKFKKECGFNYITPEQNDNLWLAFTNGAIFGCKQVKKIMGFK